MGVFTKATKKQARARIAFIGPAGSGKTFSALRVATRIGERVAVIDSERGSASKYAGKFSFDVLDLQTHEPQTYINAIRAAEQEGYDVVVIDSLSHAWMGRGGALEQVDAATKKSKSGNSHYAWRDVTPQHNALVDAMLMSRCHVVATLRAKSEYVEETDERTGKKGYRKVGLAPIQREGLDFEFDIVGDIDLDHTYVISKTRCEALDGKVFRKPGEEFADEVKEWLSDGAPAVEPPAVDVGAKVKEYVDAVARAAGNESVLSEIREQLKREPTPIRRAVTAAMKSAREPGDDDEQAA